MCYAQKIVLDLNYACNKLGGPLPLLQRVRAAAMLIFRSDSLLRQRRRKGILADDKFAMISRRISLHQIDEIKDATSEGAMGGLHKCVHSRCKESVENKGLIHCAV